MKFRENTKKITSDWTFLSNHAHVLICLADDPELRVRDIAEMVGITERAAHRIIFELEEENYIEKNKIGRRNSYKLNSDMPLRHPIESHKTIKSLIALAKK